MARTVNKMKKQQAKRGCQKKSSKEIVAQKLFRHSQPQTHGFKKANPFGMHRRLLPDFAATMKYGTDKVEKPTVCPCCKLKPCLMLSYESEVRGLGSICEDHNASAYFVQINMGDWMKNKMENLLQVKVAEAPLCFSHYLEKWFPEDLGGSSDEEEELDADELITTGP